MTCAGGSCEGNDRLAVSVLYRQIDRQPLDATRVELSTRLVVRGSTAPPRQAGE